MNQKENKVFENRFGVVTDKRIMLQYKTGYESIPLQKVSSVTFRHRRNPLAILMNLSVPVAILAFLVYSGSQKPLLLGPTELIVFGLPGVLFLGLAIKSMIGYFVIQVGSTSSEGKPVKVTMHQAKEGRELVEAINKEVFHK